MRYVTFYYDLLRDHVSDLKVHEDKEKALRLFEKNQNEAKARYTYLKALGNLYATPIQQLIK